MNATGEPLIDMESAKRILSALIPDFEWLLSNIEADGGWLRFPGFLADVVTRLKIENYPLLYENEGAIGVVFLRSFLDASELNELNLEFEAASPEDRGQLLASALEEMEEGSGEVRIPRTPEEQREAASMLERLPEEERAAVIRKAQYFFSAFFGMFGQTLSLMVHGEKLTALVAQAKSGNDDAFVKAVQIDRRILTTIPSFRSRYERAQNEGDGQFLTKLAYRLSAPTIKGRIRHRCLWLAFAMLDAHGLLNQLTHPALLQFCDDVGVGGYKNRIEDVKYLSKRLKEYREFQKRGISATP